MMTSPALRLLILGPTGLVGSQALQMALDEPKFTQVIAPSRRPLPAHTKLLNPITDFAALSDADWWAVDVAICTLGTTLKQAGSKTAFSQVDFDYVVASAGYLKEAGCRHFIVVSSLGADPESGSFYLKVKGETEQALRALGFDALTVLRPSLLDGGPRPDKRPAEAIGLWFASHLGGLIPKSYRPVAVRDVARIMVNSALSEARGERIIESAAMHHSTGKS
ncbi:NAD(P)H-binding protein [Arenimonas sp.]|jgi:uncharacterized protein YbjT (DUF2867 family)|uniref:NAD(P)H-binding protein n=1 Tax=Arenimonas sp. TaxID=1872635 RepID=UPI0037C04F42